MDRLLETMLALTQKEKDVETNAEAKRVVAQFGLPSLNIFGVTNLDGSFVHPEGGHILILVLVVNVDPLEHSTASARHGSVTDDEDQYDDFFMP